MSLAGNIILSLRHINLAPPVVLYLMGVNTLAQEWTGPAADTAATVDRVILSGSETADGFKPAAIIPPSLDDNGIAYIQPGRNVISQFSAHTFGIEQRINLAKDGDGLMLRCKAGDRPAGVILSTNRLRWPSSINGHAVVSAQGAQGVWGVSIVRPGADAPQPAQARLRSVEAELALDGAPADGALVVTCPDEAGEVHLTGIEIRAAKSGPVRPGGIGTWIWSEQAWQADPGGFAARIAKANVSDVALQIQRLDGPGAARLRELAQALRAHDVALHFVEGDPEMALPKGLPVALKRIEALRQIVRDAGLKNAVLELDIEPNGLPDYAVNTAQGWAGWSVAVRAIAETWGSKVVATVPWWMQGAPGGSAALADARASISGIVLMNYRTDVPTIINNAMPWLEWGAAHRVPVRIALENGALKPEIHRTYVRAPKGELLVSPGQERAALYAAAQTPPPGSVAFRFSHETIVPPQRISFCGNRGAVRNAQRKVGPILQAWPSFKGFKVHGLLDQEVCG